MIRVIEISSVEPCGCRARQQVNRSNFVFSGPVRLCPDFKSVQTPRKFDIAAGFHLSPVSSAERRLTLAPKLSNLNP